jgi:hypothetical protein
MTAVLAPLLDTLKAVAERAGETEKAYRRETAQRIAALERERTFAFRRLNFMRAVIAAVAGAETEEEATTRAAAALCDQIGWDGLSEARTAVLDQFAAVTKAISADLDQEAEQARGDGAVLAALGTFEAWYGATHTGPFWALFDQYVPQTSVVDF